MTYLSAGLRCRETVIALAAFLTLSTASAGPSWAQTEPAQVPEEAPAAQAPEAPATPAQEEETVPEGTPIGEIRIISTGIFDPREPGENKRVFRLANRLHFTTRPHVIERQLLFGSGDPYSRELVEESERLLRANRYLYDADIRPVRRDDGQVDLEVHTRDVWTLRLGASVSRAGGENSTNFALEDSNFLGSGKSLTVWRNSTVDRTSTLFRYRDPQLYGQHTQLEASYSDYSDGGARRFEIDRPFYSLDARWTAGFRYWRYERVDSLYDRGEIFQSFRHDHDFLEIYAGRSAGLVNDSANRWTAGVTWMEDTFTYSAGGDSTPEPPAARTIAYPWLGYEYVEDGFVAERDLDRIQRTEDLNLGRQVRLRLGWSSPSFGADENQAIFQGTGTAGWRPGGNQLVLASAEGGTRWGQEGFENLLAGGRLRYYRRNFGGNHLFYAAAEANVARQLDPETQLLLGGDTGLRGYPLRYQSGDRRYLVTLEQRFFSTWELFHLVHLGAAAFFDAGRAWFEDDPFADSNELLRDVGVGLRLGSSRSSSGAMIHLDIAYPLDGDDSIDRLQWLVRTSETF